MSGQKKLSEAEYRAAEKFRVAADRRQFHMLLFDTLAAGAIVAAVAVICSFWPHTWIPVVCAAAFLALVLAGYTWHTVRKCPHCGRLHSRKDLKLSHTESGAYQRSGDHGDYSVDYTSLVYRTRCDRCGADIWIWKWKVG